MTWLASDLGCPLSAQIKGLVNVHAKVTLTPLLKPVWL